MSIIIHQYLYCLNSTSIFSVLNIAFTSINAINETKMTSEIFRGPGVCLTLDCQWPLK